MQRGTGRARLDWLETALLCVLAFVLGVVVMSFRQTEVRQTELRQTEVRQAEVERLTGESRQLQSAYGPETNSEHQEEWVLRDFFQGKRNGVFVDVGANDYRRFSNTYYLETELGWSGIAVDPQRQFELGYREHRPRTRFRAFFVGDRSNDQAKIYLQKGNSLVASADKAFTERFGANVTEISAPTVTLDDLLESEGVTHIDFLSIDVELHEPQVLAGFSVEKYLPAFVCIEAHPEVRQQILDYFTRRQYVIAGKYLRADVENLYFMPLARH
jgi:FkbM family methyltransferase